MKQEVEGIYVAAHEMKAPLAVLRQLALSFGDMSMEDEKIRAEMISVSERAIRQVNDLTKIRRLQDGLFEMEPIAIRSLCDDVVHEARYLFDGNQQGLCVRYSNKSRLVSANRELLRSVIYNFLLNAMHYSRQETETRLSVRDCRGRVRVAVRDFGPALPVDVWRQMKEGDIEQPTSIAMRPGSSGLGLYIAAKFSRYMNADMGVIRHRDGASFYVEIPVSRQASLFV